MTIVTATLLITVGCYTWKNRTLPVPESSFPQKLSLSSLLRFPKPKPNGSILYCLLSTLYSSLHSTILFLSHPKTLLLRLRFRISKSTLSITEEDKKRLHLEHGSRDKHEHLQEENLPQRFKLFLLLTIFSSLFLFFNNWKSVIFTLL